MFDTERVKVRYLFNKDETRVAVEVSLSPSIGKEKIIRIKTNDVRQWLISETGKKIGKAEVSFTLDNNLSKRMYPNKTLDDLTGTYIFQVVENEEKAVQEKPVAEEVVQKEVEQKPKRRTRSRSKTTEKSTTTTRRTRRRTKTSTDTEVKTESTVDEKE